MSHDLQLAILKQDLEILHDEKDQYLSNLLDIASGFVTTEGIKIDGSIEIDGLISMYAAFLYRKRMGAETSMPRFLRWALNNKLFSQKGSGCCDET